MSGSSTGFQFPLYRFDQNVYECCSYGVFDSSSISGDQVPSESSSLYWTFSASPDGEYFRCKLCTYTTPKESRMKNHVRVHAGEKPFECNVCSTVFRMKHHLTDHIRTHTREKPFKCEMCGRHFTRQHHLTAHIRTHTGEKPYICNVCPKRFARLHHLKRHQKTLM